MTEEYHCRRCGKLITEEQATRNDDLCVDCYEDEENELDEETFF